MNDEEVVGVIQMDFDLLGKILTDYAHSLDHIALKDFIIVKNLEFDSEDGILTTFINVQTNTEH